MYLCKILELLEMSKLLKEIIYWALLFVLMFLFEAFNKRHPHINWSDIFFTLQYFLSSLFISYVLIPKLLYRKKYILFSLAIVVVLGLVFVSEELYLEPFFYPNTRRSYYISLWSFIDVLPPILIFTGFKFALDALEKQNKIEKISRIAAENELQFLNSQINPHFLFNNLNNLYALALEKSPETPKIILQLSGILRYMLYDCRKLEVELSKEIDNLQQFIALYEMQTGTETSINFDAEEIGSHWRIAPLILIVFVENAFKHSQASQTDKIKINISIYLENNILHFECENNYTQQSNTQNLAKGIGLENVKSKLNLLYPKAHKLTIDDDGRWYSVNLKLDLK